MSPMDELVILPVNNSPWSPTPSSPQPLCCFALLSSFLPSLHLNLNIKLIRKPPLTPTDFWSHTNFCHIFCSHCNHLQCFLSFFLPFFLPSASPCSCHNVVEKGKVGNEACVWVCVCVCECEWEAAMWCRNYSGLPIAMRACGSPGNLIGMCFLAGLIVASPNHCAQP